MKRLLLILVVLLCISCVASAQQYSIKVKYGRATTAWTKYGFPKRLLNISVSNDTTAGTDSLWVAFNKDTSATGKFPLLKNETVPFPGLQADTVYVKSSANTIPYRIWGSH